MGQIGYTVNLSKPRQDDATGSDTPTPTPSAILTHVNVGILTVDPDGTVGDGFSAYTLALFGDTPIGGSPLLSLLQLEDNTEPHTRMSSWLQAMFGANAQQWQTATDLPLRSIDLGSRHIWLDYAPLYDDGCVSRIVVTLTDVTDANRAHEAAREQQRKHQGHLALIAELSGLDANLFELFLQESATLLAGCDDTVMRLQDAVGECAPFVDAILDVIRTLDGNAKVFNITSMHKAALVLEQRLEAARDQPRGCSEEHLTSICNGIDRLHELLGDLAKLGRQVLLGDRLVGKETQQARRMGTAMRIDEARVLDLRRRYRDLALTLEESGLLRADEELARLHEAMHTAVEELSRVPLSDVFEACRKTHHDVSRELRKPLEELHLSGENLTIDSRLAAKLHNVLAHAIRNAIDHGVEATATRLASGKGELGVVGIDAHWDEGTLVLCVSDDGAGLDVDRLKLRALERRLVTDGQVDSLSDEDAVALAFLPSVSSHPNVQLTSARGEGLDAIGAAMQDLGGLAELASEGGKGTRLSLRIPDASRRYSLPASDAPDSELDDHQDLQQVVSELRAELEHSQLERDDLYQRMGASSDELLNTNAGLNAIFSALPDLFLRLDAQHVVTDHKGGGETARAHMLDLDPRDAPIETCLVAAACGPVETLLKAGRDGSPRVEYTIGIGPDMRHYEARALPLPDDNTLIAIEDATDRIRTQTALLREQVERAADLRSFASAASHDLRSPLRNIDVLAAFAQEDIDDPEAVKQHLGMLRVRVKRMEALLTGVLEYVQVGAQAVTLQPVDVADLIEETVELVVPAAFETEISGNVPQLVTARALLARVLLNLLSNAVTHHDKGHGHLSISHHVDGDSLVMVVSDDGPGIAERSRERVFGMFKRLHNNDYGGTGMGLALVRRILQRVGGTIRLDASDPRGTMAIVRWPMTWHADDQHSSLPPPQPNVGVGQPFNTGR